MMYRDVDVDPEEVEEFIKELNQFIVELGHANSMIKINMKVSGWDDEYRQKFDAITNATSTKLDFTIEKAKKIIVELNEIVEQAREIQRRAM